MSDTILQCRNLKKTYPRLSLDLDFSVSTGELVSIIGPSGSGKSTVLKLIGGIISPDSGTIAIDGNDVTALGTDRRGTAMIFRDFALFPHMNVEQNVAYPFKQRKLSKEDSITETRRLLELVNLSGFEKRSTEDLTPDEKLRVAIARALASDPTILLLDEPLMLLDSKKRLELRNEIRQIRQKTGLTTVYVRNDKEEALSISDRIIVMKSGKIDQTGSPEDIYRRPGTEFTATFTGECNILPYDVILKTLRVPETERSKVIYQCFGPEHKLLFRPEDMVVNDMPGLPFPEFFPHLRFENAKILRSEYLGKEYLVTAQYEEFIIKVYTVYKPASDFITAGIRMNKILEFNDGKLIRH
ncbi:MAG: ABC transporter ATP-binding protein [Spirochaetales bacterium]|nr:ABC transporter ATP-binding protein [Spirochaetales bacterium]